MRSMVEAHEPFMPRDGVATRDGLERTDPDMMGEVGLPGRAVA